MSRINIFWSSGLAFCPACQSPLAGEEIDFEECDSCGGDGLDELADLGSVDFDDVEDELQPPATDPEANHG